ncbi:MAG: hypothetical protein HXX14_07195 [Bacteroidetes bacterium]|nr:hypothetical protein [Bacteroidota bacterium]
MKHFKPSYKLIILLMLLFSSKEGWSQHSLFRSFLSVSSAEKGWVVKHPFIAKKAWAITERVRFVTDSLKQLAVPDQDASGGKLDAFRHSFWMASLTQKIGSGRALSLGRAHERGNYRDFKRKRFEEGDIPDKAAGEMDLYNNGIGSAIGTELKESNEKNIIETVLLSIHAGKMKVILKDIEGRSCDSLMQPIPVSLMKGRWNTPRVLVASDFKFSK